MRKLLPLILALLITSQAHAEWKFNPHTGKSDYYEKGAPTTATYVTTTADATLSNEFSLGTLGNGLLKNTTVVGVGTPSIATADVDYLLPVTAASTFLKLDTSNDPMQGSLDMGTFDISNARQISAGDFVATSGGWFTAYEPGVGPEYAAYYHDGAGAVFSTNAGNVSLLSPADVEFFLGDNAGVNKVIIRDLATNEVAYINSDGEFDCTNFHILDAETASTDTLILSDAIPVGISGANGSLLIGHGAGTALTTGDYNTLLGCQAHYYNATGIGNTVIGYKAGYGVITKNNSYNTFIGYESGYKITTGLYNTFIGYVSGLENTTGSGNTLIGYNAGVNNNTGGSNTAIGYGALQGTGVSAYSENVGIGYNAGTEVTNGEDNTLIGAYAGYKNTSGDYNVAIGYTSDGYNLAGSSNVAIGYRANRGAVGSSSSYNISIGYQAGLLNRGNSNILIGYNAADNLTTGTNNIWIDYDSDTPAVNTSNYLRLGDYLIGDLNAGSTVGASLQITAGAATQIGLIVKGAAAQSANLQQWRNSADGVLGYVTSTAVSTMPNFISTVAIGTSPYACTSTTLNTNLNADLLDGLHAADITSPPGGADTQVQYNNGGVFGGDAGMTYNDATDTLTLVGDVIADNAYMASDSVVGFEGSGGNTYAKYNSTSGKHETWVDGVLKAEL